MKSISCENNKRKVKWEGLLIQKGTVLLYKDELNFSNVTIELLIYCNYSAIFKKNLVVNNFR
ncbi:MAG: hypothetical protein ACOVLC_09285, partial [Flavobacterium sp.]